MEETAAFPFRVSFATFGGRHEHFFLSKAFAILEPDPAALLVGSEKAPDAPGRDRRSVCAAERLA